MKLFALIVEDRHTDVDVRLFVHSEKAIAIAKEIALGMGDRKDFDEVLSSEMIRSKWIYNCGIGEEGEGVRVVEVEVERDNM